MRSRTILSILLFLSAMVAVAHPSHREKIPYPSEKCYIFQVMLKDKNGTPFTLDKPSAYISQRALERRARQGLKVDSTDLPVSPVYLKRLSRYDISIVGVSKWNNAVLVSGTDLQQLVRLVKVPFVKSVKQVWVSPDSVYEPEGREVVHEDFRKWDSVPGKFFGAANEQTKMLHAQALHTRGYDGKGFVIAVLDGGFMNIDKIPAFASVNILGTHDFVVGSRQNVYREMDHGTKVLSTMALNQPEVFRGTAPGASYWLLRCEDGASEYPVEEFYWAEAAEFADSVGADIISSSLGYHAYDDPTASYKYADQDGKTALISRTASLLAGKGIVLVNSAGNDGRDTWKKINFPADASNILSVGAVSLNGLNAPFSSIGPTADGRIKPDVMAPGCPDAVVGGRGTIVYCNGTSFAAPLISGMVACLWQAFPKKTALQIMDMVRKLGNNASTPDNIFGYGIPNFEKVFETANQQK